MIMNTQLSNVETNIEDEEIIKEDMSATVYNER